MNKSFFPTLLLLAVVCAHPLRGQEKILITTTENVRFGGSVWDKRMSYVFPGMDFLFDVYSIADKGVSVRFISTLGRFSSGFLLLPGQPGPPDKVRMLKRPDGSLISQSDFPLLGEEKSTAQLSMQVIQNPKYAGWMFFRLRKVQESEPDTPSAKNMPGRLSGFYLSMLAKPQSLVRKPVSMFLAWPGGTARAGESIPWSNQKPDFNALGIYVKGANEEMESDFIVFDPAQIAGIKLTRWKNYDGGMTMAFQAEAVSEVVFAIGCAAGENGGEVAVPRFLKDERTRIFQALRAIEWAMPFDFEKLQKLLDETGKMLKAHPDDALQARFDRLKDAIRQAAAGNQTEAYIQLEKQLHELNRELVDASLDKMLE